MNITEIKVNEYERIVKAELVSGVQAIIAIHNTRLGPALGGCRFYNYASIDDALTDALRLSEGMTYKSAMAGLPLGGGKSVICGDPEKVKSTELLLKFADFVDSQGGRYITAKDVGISVEDLDVMAQRTAHVRGTSAKDSSGDPSPMTAFGVYQGMKASAQFLWKDSSLKGKRVVIQGLGHVGQGLVKHLAEEGATILACEIHEQSAKAMAQKYDVEIIGLNDWHKTKADIFAPCAMGAILDATTLPALNEMGIQIIAGGANNQLKDLEKDGEKARQLGLIYAPDYIINAGGIINIAGEVLNENQDWAYNKTKQIYTTTLTILERAQAENLPTSLIALKMARERVGLA